MSMINTAEQRRRRRRKSRRRSNAAGQPKPSPNAARAAQPRASAPAARAAVPSDDGKTKRELMLELDLLGVDYSPRAKKSELAALLWAAKMSGGDGNGE